MRNILLIDDSPADQIAIRRAVEDAKLHCAISVVENGIEALSYLRGEKMFRDRTKYPLPDILLMDINMPLLDGKETLIEIRGDATFRSLPVIILSTSNSQEDIKDAYEHGANAYITKPYSDTEYQKTVSSLSDFWFHAVQLPLQNKNEN